MLLNETGAIFLQENLWPKIALSLAGAGCLGLLGYVIIHPFLKKSIEHASIEMHPEAHVIKDLTIPSFKKIAIALDFSANDEKLLAYALGQGNADAHYLLIHIVESAQARLLGKESDDYETRKDKEIMDSYVRALQDRGLNAEGFLGYRNQSKEIVRIVKGINADMLILGAHGHSGLKDFVYGQTVESVRHELKIPVLIVNV